MSVLSLFPLLSRRGQGWSDPPLYIAIGPSPIQLVVVMAVRKAVSAATTTFTAISTIRFFIIVNFQLSIINWRSLSSDPSRRRRRRWTW